MRTYKLCFSSYYFFSFVAALTLPVNSTHPKMTTQEGEDVDKPFIEKDWIGRGKIYNRTTLPAFVTIAIFIYCFPSSLFHRTITAFAVFGYLVSQSGQIWAKKSLIRPSGQNFENFRQA